MNFFFLELCLILSKAAGSPEAGLMGAWVRMKACQWVMGVRWLTKPYRYRHRADGDTAQETKNIHMKSDTTTQYYLVAHPKHDYRKTSTVLEGGRQIDRWGLDGEIKWRQEDGIKDLMKRDGQAWVTLGEGYSRMQTHPCDIHDLDGRQLSCLDMTTL